MIIAQNLSIIKKDKFQDYATPLMFANEVLRNVNKRLNKHLTSNKDYESDNILIIESKPRHGFGFKIETLKERNVKH